MSKLDLPNVTLLFVETRAHTITKRVIDDCLSKVNFGSVLIYTDKQDLIPVDGARYVDVPDFPDKKTAGQFYYQHACAGIETSHALMLEWDAGIKDISKWRNEFLTYDYIGAPWLVRPQEINTMDVGNGGFALMSKKLGDFLHTNSRTYPVYTDWDLCRVQRKHLEHDAEFKWPRRDLAAEFAWELTERPAAGVFGYHATFTWPWMLDREEVITRAKMMTESPYLLTKMRDLVKKAPWLLDTLTDDERKRYEGLNPAQGRGPNFTAAQRAKANYVLTQRRALYMSQMTKAGLKA